MTRTGEELQRRDLDAAEARRAEIARYSPATGEAVDYTVTRTACPKCGNTISRFVFADSVMADVHYCPDEIRR